MTFGNTLKKLRKQNSLTQEDLAKLLGTANSTISMYERDSRVPDFETMRTIADIFRVDMNYLLGYSPSCEGQELTEPSENQISAQSERIKLLIGNSNLSYIELEKRTGIPKSSLQRYASGTTAKIPLDVIEKLSNAFNVSPEYLMGWTEEKKKKSISPEEPQLTEGEQTMLDLFRRVPEDQQKLVLQMIRAALGNQE